MEQKLMNSTVLITNLKSRFKKRRERPEKQMTSKAQMIQNKNQISRNPDNANPELRDGPY